MPRAVLPEGEPAVRADDEERDDRDGRQHDGLDGQAVQRLEAHPDLLLRQPVERERQGERQRDPRHTPARDREVDARHDADGDRDPLEAAAGARRAR